MNRYWNYLLWCLLVLGGCKGCDEKPKPKLDPNFKMGMAHIGGVFQEFDTTYIGYDVHFRANDSLADMYRWEIGAVPKQYKRTAGIYFPDNSQGRYKIKLTIRKNLGQDSLVDSTVRYLTVTSPLVHFPPIYGKYRGYDTEKPDSLFTVWVCFGKTDPPKMDSSYVWYPPCCSWASVWGLTSFFYPEQVAINYKNIWNEAEGFRTSEIFSLTSIKGELALKYKLLQGGNYVEKTFRGSKTL